MESTFNDDLTKEGKLAYFLDNTYYNNQTIFPPNYTIERISDINLQHKGVDIIITDTNSNNQFYIDEKAQLDYINKTLPTFAFELSYLKNGVLKEGWLFDKSKITEQYFLITCIHQKDNKFQSCRLISLDRFKFLTLLEGKRLTQDVLKKYETAFRKNKEFGKQYIHELKKNEGSLNYTEHKAEKPINLVMQLQYLLNEDVCIELNPCQL